MRIKWITAIAALALLGGCDSNGQNGKVQSTSVATVAEGSEIMGSVTLRDPRPFGDAPYLDVQLVDVKAPEIAIAAQKFAVSGEAPYRFTLPFDRSKIMPRGTYEVKVVLVDGPRRYVQALSSLVLTHGAGTDATMTLNTEPTAAENLFADCNSLERKIGGMRMVSGNYTTDETSVAWDAFVEGKTVRFVRINTDFDAGGHTSVNHAFYKEGQPMCAKEPGGSRTRWNVGWTAEGKVLFATTADGGELAESAVANYRSGAEQALKLAQARADATQKKK